MSRGALGRTLPTPGAGGGGGGGGMLEFPGPASSRGGSTARGRPTLAKALLGEALAARRPRSLPAPAVAVPAGYHAIAWGCGQAHAQLDWTCCHRETCPAGLRFRVVTKIVTHRPGLTQVPPTPTAPSDQGHARKTWKVAQNKHAQGLCACTRCLINLQFTHPPHKHLLSPDGLPKTPSLFLGPRVAC